MTAFEGDKRTDGEHKRDIARRTIERLQDMGTELDRLRQQFSMLREYAYTQGWVTPAATLSKCEESVQWLVQAAPNLCRDIIEKIEERDTKETGR